MQLNGTSGTATIMAASEPPEPPPRNPDRINASLNKLIESKITKSLDTTDKTAATATTVVNNNKPLKPILSLDNNIGNCSNSSGGGGSGGGGTAIATTSTTILNSGGSGSSSSSSSSSGSSSKTSPMNPTTSPPLSATQITAPPPSITNKRFELTSSQSITNSGQIPFTTTTSIINSPPSNQSSITAPTAVGITNNSNLDNNYQRSIMVTNGDLSASTAAAINTTTINSTSSMISASVGGLITGNGSSSAATVMTTNTSDLNQYRLKDGGSNELIINGSSNNAIITTAQNDINNLYSKIGEKTSKLLSSSVVNGGGAAAATGGNGKQNSVTGGLQQSIANAGNNQSGTINYYNGGQQILGLTNENNQTSLLDQDGTGGGGSNTDDFRFDTDNRDNKDINSTKLRLENEKLNIEIIRLRKLLENSPDGAVGGIELSDNNTYDIHSTDGVNSQNNNRLDRLEAELKLAKQQITAMRIERKKLKSDKCDLLAHVKQLCASLQDKEQELRDFIRNFEQRIRESENSHAKISTERERERWSLLKHARDEAERSLALAQQLNSRDVQLQRTQEQLQEARRQLSGCLSDQESLLSFAPLTPPSGLMAHMTTGGGGAGGGGGGSTSGNILNTGFTNNTDRGSCSADSGVRGSSDRESTAGDLNLSDGTCENGPCITVDPDSISIVSSQHMYQFGTPKERSPTLSPLNSAAYSRSVEQLGSPVDSEGPSLLTRKFPTKTATSALSGRTGRGGTWGSISRVFARSRNKNKINNSQEVDVQDYNSWSPLTEEGYAEKLRLLREASQIPIDRWRASQVLAWLEVALGMPQYSTRCSENVKSGKVLLELNDSELETGLGLVHPMHRKKLRLAIEEQRRPDLVRYPSIAQLGHTWVASEWLPDIGLPQYAEPFIHSLVDARMLDTLSKKELEKFLGVTRKFHQASIVHGIHVLRIVKYDRQTLALRRLQCENVDADPIVWTNQRFVRWARSIDLSEYADNLKDSGVHGGLVVLEPSFSGDTMATALGIPPSKNIIRRHLSTEFEALVLPARGTLGQGIRSGCGVVPITGPGGLQHYFSTTDRRSSGSLRISGWKGSQSSLSKAFRFNTKSRSSFEKSFGNSTSPTPSYSSSEGGGVYSTIGQPLLPAATQQQPLLPPPPSHRVSAPPIGIDSMTHHHHRRVKSISDIEIVAAPV